MQASAPKQGWTRQKQQTAPSNFCNAEIKVQGPTHEIVLWLYHHYESVKGIIFTDDFQLGT